MNLITNKKFLIKILVFSLFSCNTEFNQNGYELLNDKILTSSSFSAPVYLENKEISDIQTNNTPYHQIGNYKHSFFGQFSSRYDAILTKIVYIFINSIFKFYYNQNFLEKELYLPFEYLFRN